GANQGIVGARGGAVSLHDADGERRASVRRRVQGDTAPPALAGGGLLRGEDPHLRDSLESLPRAAASASKDSGLRRRAPAPPPGALPETDQIPTNPPRGP